MNKRNPIVISRRLALLIDYLKTHEYPNAVSIMKDLDEYYFSRKTVIRDISELQNNYGAPIAFDFSRNGYYFTDPDYAFGRVMLSEGEILSIAVIERLMSQYKNTPLEQTMADIWKKVAVALPDIVQVDSSFINNSVSMIAEPLPVIDKEVFARVLSARKLARTISFSYRSLNSDKNIQRQADPYHIICQKGNWYLLAFCHVHKEVRRFAFSRMSDVTFTGQSFTLPEGFNPRDYFDPEIGIWHEDKPFSVSLRFSKEIALFASERTWHTGQKLIHNSDGSVQLDFTTNQFTEVTRFVLGFGPLIQVLNPPELKEKIKMLAAETAAYY